MTEYDELKNEVAKLRDFIDWKDYLDVTPWSSGGVASCPVEVIFHIMELLRRDGIVKIKDKKNIGKQIQYGNKEE